MSDENEKQAAPVYPTPATAPAPVLPQATAPAYPTPVTAPVPPVYPTPVTAPVYPTPVPAPVPAKVETPYIYPTTVPPPPVPAPVPAKAETPYIYPTTPQPVPVPVTTANGKIYQEQLLAPCAAGHHDPTTKFGTCGIITAICCFPIGLLCLCADKETRCARCGVLLA